MKDDTSRSNKRKSEKKSRKDAPAIEWLRDISGKTARITCMGGRTLLVENHRGVIEFSAGLIRLTTGCGTICVCGDDLSIHEMRRDALVIRGMIRHVEMPCAAPADHGR